MDVNPAKGVPYYHDFPFFTIKDMINAYSLLQAELQINKIKIGIGGSAGGQQIMEWAVQDPDLFEKIFLIATNAVHSPWGKAFNASQRFAIETDHTWLNKTDDAGKKGLEVARSIALLSYRTDKAYNKTQCEINDDLIENFKSESYQRYQGSKLSARFNAFSYYMLTKSMDSHNLGRGRGGLVNALASIKARTLVLSMEGDLLFPSYEQEFIANHVANAQINLIGSEYGHDEFLLEFEQLTEAINRFY